VPSITVDDKEGGRLLAHHLAERGLQTVIYRDWYTPPTSGHNRRIGFEAAARDLGIEVIEGRRLHQHDLGEPLPEELAVIERHGRVAIACWSDDGAYATCNAFSAVGYKIPDQILVTGYNGVPLHFTPRWDLTTVVAPWRRVGEVAVEALLARIAGNATPPHLTLPVVLRVGGTT
jgi:LacI family transcriptional regulator